MMSKKIGIARPSRGTVIRWLPNVAAGYGFIKPDGESHDVYLQSYDVTSGKIFEGARVEFWRIPSKIMPGRYHANNVRVI
jgi:cold shock CspA family protein